MNTILVFAFDESTRDSIKAALCHHIPLIVTEDLEQCLETLNQKTPIHKIVFGVSGMNEESCEEAIKEILTLQPKMIIIAVGNKKDEALAVNTVRFGASGYMLLPFKAQELLTTVRQ